MNFTQEQIDKVLDPYKSSREEIEQLRAEVADLKKENETLYKDRNEAFKLWDELKARTPDTSQLERFRKALEFYANGAERVIERDGKKHWVREYGCGCCSQSYEVEEDGGRGAMDCELDDVQGMMAREALAGSEKESPRG